MPTATHALLAGSSLAYSCSLQHTHCSTAGPPVRSSQNRYHNVVVSGSWPVPCHRFILGSSARSAPVLPASARDGVSVITQGWGTARRGSYRIENFTCVQLACTVVLYGVTRVEIDERILPRIQLVLLGAWKKYIPRRGPNLTERRCVQCCRHSGNKYP